MNRLRSVDGPSPVSCRIVESRTQELRTRHSGWLKLTKEVKVRKRGIYQRRSCLKW